MNLVVGRCGFLGFLVVLALGAVAPSPAVGAGMVVSFTATPNPGLAGIPVTFDARASEPSVPGMAITKYEWDFNGDGVFEVQIPTAVTQFTYVSPGGYPVRLRITDQSGAWAVSPAPVFVNMNANRPPVARAGGPYTIQSLTVLSLDASGSTDPDVAYGDRIVAYDWDLDADGQFDDWTSSIPTTSVPYSTLATILGARYGAPANYLANASGQPTLPIAVRVRDSLGGTGASGSSLVVLNRAPTAAAGPDQTVEGTGPEGAPVTLDGSGSADPELEPLVARWTKGQTVVAASLAATVPLGFGTHDLTLTVTDVKGVTATDTVRVVVQDTIPPTVQAPADVAMESLTPGVTVALGSPVVTDVCDPSPAITNDAPATYPFGVTPVTWTATDRFGNSATATTTVTITQIHVPVAAAGPDQTLEGETPAGAAVTLDASASSDADGDPLTATWYDGAVLLGTGMTRTFVLGLGTHDLLLIVNDGRFDSAPDPIRVIVRDTTPPSLVAPPDVTVEALASGVAVPLGEPQVADLCDATPTVTNDAPATFAIGITTVTWTARDDTGNVATAEQTITVLQANRAPTARAGGDQIVEGTSPGGAVVTLDAGASTDPDGDPWTATWYEGSTPIGTGPLLTLPLDFGTHDLHLVVNDGRLDSVPDPVQVRVVDTTAPTVVAPPDVRVESPTPGVIVTIGTPVVTDACDPAPVVTHDAPETFPFGVTTVTWTATDRFGNAGRAPMTVTVVQPEVNDPPIANAGGPYLIAERESLLLDASASTDPDPGDRIVGYAWDLNGDGNYADVTTASPTHTVPWDTLKALLQAAGITRAQYLTDPRTGLPKLTIRVRVTDAEGLTGTAATDLRILSRRNTLPVANAGPDQTPEATSAAGAVVRLDGSGSRDPDDDPLTARWLEGTTLLGTDLVLDVPLALGAHTITLIVNDGLSDSAPDTVLVTVRDTTPPVLVAPEDVTVVSATPDVAVPLGAPQVSDLCDPSPEVSNDAPATYPFGTTLVTWTARDRFGNVAADATRVTVTRDVPPIADAGPDQTAEATSHAGARVRLDGSVSRDPEGAPLTVRWTEGATLLGTSLVLEVDLPLGPHTITLVVNDGRSDSPPDTVVVTVVDTTPPTISAPADVTVDSDTDRTAVPLGTPTTSDLADADLTVTNDAPPSGFPFGTTTVTWRATDDAGHVAEDTQTVTVNPVNRPPTAVAGGPYAIQEGTPLTLDAGGSSDPDVAFGDRIVRYAWDLDGDGAFDDVVTEAPGATLPYLTLRALLEAGGLARERYIADPATGEPHLTIALRVEDTAGLDSSVTTTLRILRVPNTAPIARAGSDRIAEAMSPQGATVRLDGTMSSDPDRDPLSAVWTWNGAVIATAIVADVPLPLGVHTITLVVTDGKVDSAPDDVLVTVRDTRPPLLQPPPNVVVYSTTAPIPVTLGAPQVSDHVDPGPTVTHDAPAAFSFGHTTVTWRAVDASGNVATAPQRVSVMFPGGNGPVAIVSFAPASPTAGQTVTFDGRSSYHTDVSASITRYEWDFQNDGRVDATGSVAAYAYAMPGTYTARLIVYGSSGGAGTRMVSVTVLPNWPNAPVADAGGPYSVEEGGTLRLDASASSDADAPLGDRIVSYAWDLDGDGAFDDWSGTTSAASLSYAAVVARMEAAGLTPAQYLADPETREPKRPIALRVTDATGKTGTDTTTLTLVAGNGVNDPPVAVAGPDLSVEAGSPTHLTSAGSTDPEGEPLTARWLEGTTLLGEGQTLDVVLPIGPHTVTLIVNDGFQDSAPDHVVVTVSDTKPPVIAKPADITQPCNNPSGDVLYLPQPAVTDAGDPAPVVTSDAPDVFPCGLTIVTWTATDASGNSASTTQKVTLLDRSYPGRLVPVIVVSPSPVQAGDPVVLDGSHSYFLDPPFTITQYEWDLPGGALYERTGAAITHVFSSAGSYPVRLRIRNTYGATAERTATVLVLPASLPPVADAGGPYIVEEDEPLLLDASASFDPDQDRGDSIAAYDWDLGGDGTFEVTSATPSTSVSAAALRAALLASGVPESALLANPETGQPMHPVVLRVRDSGGLTATDATTVRVFPANTGNISPVADAGPDQTVSALTPEGATVELNAEASYDLNGDLLSAEWTRDGQVVGEEMVATLTLALGRHEFQLRVHDGRAYSVPDTVVVTIVDDRPPTIGALEPIRIVIPMGQGAAVPLTPPTVLDNCDESPTLTHDAPAVFPYGRTVVTWTATDDSGNVATALQTVDLVDPRYAWSAIVPSIRVTPNPAYAERDVTFDATGTFLQGVGGTITSYEWIFYLATGAESASGPTVTRRYPSAGQFLVRLTVRDSRGNVENAETTLVVITTDHPPVAAAGGPYYLEENDALVLDASGSSDPDSIHGDAIVSYAWDLNADGQADVVGTSPQATVPWADLQALLAGRVPPFTDPSTLLPRPTIRLTVTDTNGRTGSAETLLAIYADGTGNLSPLAMAGPDQTVLATSAAGARVHLDGSASFDRNGSPIVSATWSERGTVLGQGLTLDVDLALGEHEITLVVSDGVLASEPDVLLVTVRDGTPPALAVAPDYVVSGDATWVPVRLPIGTATATDLVDPAPVVTRQPPEGFAFPLGQTIVTWTATDAAGNAATALQRVIVQDPTYGRLAPILVVTPQPACTTREITFDASRSYNLNPPHDIAGYFWDFNEDGDWDAEGPVVTRTYDLAGEFLVILEIHTAQGEMMARELLLTVETFSQAPPTVVAGGPYVMDEGTPLRLDAGGSLDPDAPCGDRIVEYAWDLDGDGGYDDAVGAEPVVQVAYADLARILEAAGLTRADYLMDAEGGGAPLPVRVVARDSAGLSAAAETTLSIVRTNRRPVVVAPEDVNAYLGDRVCLPAVVLDEDGDDVTWTWWIADAPVGSAPTLAGSDTATACLEGTAVEGDYVLRVVAFDGKDAGIEDQVVVHVRANLPPSAVATVLPDAGDAPLPVVLDASGSTDPEGGPLHYRWEFDDGAEPVDAVSTTHTYEQPGVYVVTLTVTDERGASSTYDLVVTATEPANRPPEAAPEAVPEHGPAPLTVGFFAYATDPDGDPLTYLWDFGDPAAPGTSTDEEPTHTFHLPGTYVVRLTVSDGEAATVRELTVVVDPLLSLDVTSARLKWRNRKDQAANVSLDAALDARIPGPRTVIRFFFEGNQAFAIPFADFRYEDGIYKIRTTDLLVDLDFVNGLFRVDARKMLVLGFNPANGVTAELAFDGESAVETFDMVRQGNDDLWLLAR